VDLPPSSSSSSSSSPRACRKACDRWPHPAPASAQDHQVGHNSSTQRGAPHFRWHLAHATASVAAGCQMRGCFIRMLNAMQQRQGLRGRPAASAVHSAPCSRSSAPAASAAAPPCRSRRRTAAPRRPPSSAWARPRAQAARRPPAVAAAACPLGRAAQCVRPLVQASVLL
jgi:hypothetical protein